MFIVPVRILFGWLYYWLEMISGATITAECASHIFMRHS
jgi:hypothetical protein